MLVFFTDKDGVSTENADAVDIVSDKYTIRVRISGIQIYDNKAKEIIGDKELDLNHSFKEG